MGVAIDLNPHNLHEFEVNARRMLFHIPSSALFEADPVSCALIELLRERGAMPLTELQVALAGRFACSEIAGAVDELQQLDILSAGETSRSAALSRAITRFPLNTVVLNVNTGCNLSCSYCYKEDLATPARGEKMDAATAIQAIEMLLAESPDESRYNLVFFGGEPLTNLGLIREVVSFATPRFARAGKRVDFSLTTNATLLDEATIDYLDAHRFGIAVSIDGPKAIHDRNRITVGGRGTYETVARKVRLLLTRYRSRPVGARVTLTRGSTDVVGIWDHLFNDLGFAEVGFAPVTAGDRAEFNLDEAETAAVFAAMKELGQRYLEAALENRSIGFSNLHQLLTDIHQGTKKALPCGAGYSMLAVDKDGELNLCHRFTGSDLPTFGSVHAGIDRGSLSDFLARRLDRSASGCDTCRIRNLCSGGCYHESYQRYNDPSHPVYHYCELMRDWVDNGLKIYTQILEQNPAFFDTHLSPRRATR